MKRVLYLTLILVLIIIIPGQVILADETDVDKDLIVQISLQVSKMNLSQEEKVELQERLLELVYEGQINAEDLLNELNIIQKQNTYQYVESIQLMVMVGVKGIDRGLVVEIRENIGQEEMRKLATEINDAIEKGLNGDRINEILQNREMLQNMEQVREALQKAVSEQNREREILQEGKEDKTKENSENKGESYQNQQKDGEKGIDKGNGSGINNAEEKNNNNGKEEGEDKGNYQGKK